ncbi:MAG: glycine/betaine ABC transporter substrate-binding protein [Peptococcaceae bacterium]|nr:glycine/betaine ABC transporter substrate-binding protein [Peptococcaceae bacterium]
MKHITRKLLTLTVLCCFAVFALAGCGSDNKESETIRIGAKSMTEQMILQEILAQLIEAKTDLTVERIEPIAGGTSNIQISMENGEMDLYPEYTGTGWLTVLKHEETQDADYMFAELNKQYNEKYDMSWVGLYGFENTYTLAVRAETAAQYGLTKISDLAAVSDELVFGANFDYFEREDGYAKVCAVYDLQFKDTAEVDMGLKYQTLVEKNCDVLNAYTTDSQIAEFGLVTLADDKKLFTDYRCSTVVRNEVLKAHPELQDVLMLMEGLISNEEMTQMNYELNTNHRLESEIAAEFLKAKGMID